MGFFKNLFNKNPVNDTLEGAGNLAIKIRQAITGEINPEKKAELEAQLLTIEANIKQAQANVIMSEANGQSWLQRSWRPITMLTFLLLVVLDSFGWLPFRLAKEAWELLKIGLGGYVIGRSAETVAKTWNK